MPVLNYDKIAALNVVHYNLSHDYRSKILAIFSKTTIFKNIYLIKDLSKIFYKLSKIKCDVISLPYAKICSDYEI